MRCEELFCTKSGGDTNFNLVDLCFYLLGIVVFGFVIGFFAVDLGHIKV